MSFHAFWNWSQGKFWGTPVSNLEMATTIFTFPPTPGHDLLTGGSFGLEGSLATITTLLCGDIFFHLKWRKQK